MPGRIYNGGNYRYGFNGKENDNEVKGNGNSVDFGDRMQDSRLGRWLSVDPLFAKYPSISPYAFVNNTPLIAVDPDGRDIIFVNTKVGEKEDPQVTKQNFESIINTLYSTAKGKELLEYYINNPEEHIYIAIGEIKEASDGPGTLGTTHTMRSETRDKDGMLVDTKQQAHTSKDVAGKDALSEFKDVSFDENVKKSSLIILDEKIYTDKSMDFYEQKDGGGSKGGAKVLGHEIGAHVKNAPEAYSGEGHTKWGQGVYEGKFKPGQGEAKELNTQVNKVRQDTKSSDLKLQSTGKNGIYKVTK